MTIDRHEQLSPERWFKDYIDQGRPVIVSKACAHWPAMQKWSPAYLREHFGSTVVRFNGGSTTLASVLDAMHSSSADAPSPYLIECFLYDVLPGLLPDIPNIPLDSHNRVNSPLVFRHNIGRSGNPDLLIGGVGSQFPVLHWDFNHLHAFITQVRGNKRFWLYPPSETPYLYPETERPNRSRIDRFDAESLKKWPLHQQARVMVADVLEGETIFVPNSWWHRTEVLSPSIALTWNGVSKVNWQAYIEDRFVSWTRSSRLKTVLKQTYYGLVGKLLDVTEPLRKIR